MADAATSSGTPDSPKADERTLPQNGHRSRGSPQEHSRSSTPHNHRFDTSPAATVPSRAARKRSKAVEPDRFIPVMYRTSVTRRNRLRGGGGRAVVRLRP